VLLVSEDGVFVLSESAAHRLAPFAAEIEQWLEEDDSADEPPRLSIDMAHGAVSKDGRLIAIGHQDSAHLVFDSDFELVASIGNRSEYPHHALFSADDSVVGFNSCHFYSGVTVGVARSSLAGLATRPYEDDARVSLLQDGARVYAGVCRGDEFMVGDASGYVRAFSTSGEYRWQHFIGSSVGAMDLSRDNSTLVVSTYAGFVSIIRLDVGRQEPYQIGDGGHVEQRRWLFWQNEAGPLIW